MGRAGSICASLPLRHFVLTEGFGEILDQIGGGDGPSTQLLSREVTRQPMQVDAQDGGFQRLHVLTDECGNHPGQHVAGATGGHARVTRLIHIKTLAVGDHRALPLQYDRTLEGLEKISGGLELLDYEVEILDGP